MQFESEEEKELYFSSVGNLNKLMGNTKSKDDYHKEQRKNFIVIKGGENKNVSLSKQNVCKCEHFEQDKNNFELNDNNNSSLNLEKGDDEELKKNIRQRADGRWEYRKMINGHRYFLVKRKQEDLISLLKTFKQELKDKKEVALKTIKKKESFFELCKNWVEIYKNGIKSKDRYVGVVNKYFKEMNMTIHSLKKDNIQKFLNGIQGHRNRAYARYIVKGVFENEFEQRKIKYNIASNLKIQTGQTKKGANFTLEEQKLILNNLNKTPIKNEIMFYLLTGCRLSEPFDVQINYERKIIFVNGTKTKSSQRYVRISKKYAEFLKESFESMFKFNKDYYTRNFKKYLDLLKIKEKTLHDMRHTFSTNLYYLGVTDKQRQAYLGHSSIVVTNDIYTHLDPSITKQDILDLYKELYPNF